MGWPARQVNLPTLMKVLAGGLFSPGHGEGEEGAGGGWGLSQAVLGAGGRRGSRIRSNLGSCSGSSSLGKDQLVRFSSDRKQHSTNREPRAGWPGAELGLE